ncbi:MAG: DUF2510 domain-containing protein [Propionibacteriaceae bacterium]|jgi:hypothetical protein|nr:DUF2510 domain-containing protein [Propionibacteriaceae bacterium]
MTEVHPGWLPDPQNPSLLRWWDGRQWTSHTQALPPPPVQQIQQPVSPMASNDQWQGGAQTPSASQSVPGQESGETPPIRSRFWLVSIIVIGICLIVFGIAFTATQQNNDEGTNTLSPTGSQSSLPRASISPTVNAERAASESAAAEASRAARASQQAEAEATRRAAEAAAEAERFDPATYSAVSNRDWLLVERDPDSFIGKKYVLYGRVTQADAATGTTSIRVDTAGERPESVWDYDVNTIVTANEDLLKTIVKDDLVTLYVSVMRAYTYDTSIGGTATAVMVTANIIEVTG